MMLDDQRTVLLVDMDAFFASVEQQVNPALRGKPIAVVGSGHRTVVTTRSYEARAYGVKTGMNIWEAKQACPHIILVVGDTDKYTHTCRELASVYGRFTPDLEIYSIDEAFLDLTATQHLFGGPEAVGSAIKKEIKKMFGINCTVGIGPNMLIAKLAGDIAKPDGLLRVKEAELQGFLEDMPVGQLWGIGRKTEAKLNNMGIKTCGELGRTPASLLRNMFGIYGEALHDMGRGISSRQVVAEEGDPKSIGHSMTLPKDIHLRHEIEAHLLRLSEKVGRRARKYGFMGSTVSVVFRYPDFETFSMQKRLSFHTNDTHLIYSNVLDLLDSIRLKDRIRLLGVSISGLLPDTGQLCLIKSEQKRRDLLKAMDDLNSRYGDHSVNWGSYMAQKKRADVISPAWRPEGVRRSM